jgi:hypothetical protein
MSLEIYYFATTSPTRSPCSKYAKMLKCHRILDSTHFEIKENGDPFANCSICHTKSRDAKAAAANNKIIEEVALLILC